jgi:shikimate kinase
LLTGDARQRLEQLAIERRDAYDEVATVVVDTEGCRPGQVASRVAAVLHRSGAFRDG